MEEEKLMPTYVYRCIDCGYKVEVQHKLKDEPLLPEFHEHVGMKDGTIHTGEFVKIFTPPNLVGMPTRGPKNSNDE